MPLVCLDIHNEYQSVVLLNLLHRTLCVEGVDDHLVGIESWFMGNRFSWVLWRSGKDKGLWSVERGGQADFSGFFAVHLKQFSGHIAYGKQLERITYPFECSFCSLIRFRTGFGWLRGCR